MRINRTMWSEPRRLSDDQLQLLSEAPARRSSWFWPLNVLRAVIAVWPTMRLAWWKKAFVLPLFLLLTAYVQPSSRTTGTLITAAIWNQDVVDNVIYLYTYGGYLNADTTETPIANSTTQTTIFTHTLAANTLGTNKLLRLWLHYVWHEDNGGAETWTIRIKYGSTTLITLTLNSANSNVDRGGWISVAFWADGATNAQEAHAILVDTRMDQQYGTGTATEVSTGALAFVVTAQCDQAGANKTFTFKAAALEGAYTPS